MVTVWKDMEQHVIDTSCYSSVTTSADSLCRGKEHTF